MKFTSTRDARRLYTLEEALFSGYAPDGGLFVPQELPTLVDASTLLEWSKLSFVDLSAEVVWPFCQEEMSSKAVLKEILQKALSGFEPPARPSLSSDTVPVVPLSSSSSSSSNNNNNNNNDDDHQDDDDPPHEAIYIAELFWGPTFCFKDLGMRVTIFLLNYFASKGFSTKKTRVTLVVSTTGDTGPAAVRAVNDLNSPNLGLLVHYPQGQISDFQRRQLTTSQSNSIRIIEFQGGGDDMDRPIKNIMTKTKDQPQQRVDEDEDEDDIVCGVNSYNIGRPLMQMVHFIWTYLRVAEQQKLRQANQPDCESQSSPSPPPPPSTPLVLDIIIPTGAMGNMAACYMAKQMGLPLGMLNAGVNVNDITHRTFSTGQIKPDTSSNAMKKTLSDAINIQLPYNLERLLFYLTKGSHNQVRAWYDAIEGQDGGGGRAELNQEWLTVLQQEFRSARVTDEELCLTLQQVLQRYQYWADPHTGVAFAAAHQLGYLDLGPLNSSSSSSKSSPSAASGSNKINDDDGPRNASVVALMATAAPCKFQEAVTVALGQTKWDEYERDFFPAAGKVLRTKPETPPMVYHADPTKTLAENQVDWEARTRSLIAQLQTAE